MSALLLGMVGAAWICWNGTSTLPLIVQPGIINRIMGSLGLAFAAAVVWAGILTLQAVTT